MSLMLLFLLVMLKILVNMKIYKKLSIIRVQVDLGLSLKPKYFLSGSGKVVGAQRFLKYSLYESQICYFNHFLILFDELHQRNVDALLVKHKLLVKSN